MVCPCDSVMHACMHADTLSELRALAAGLDTDVRGLDVAGSPPFPAVQQY